VPDSPANGDRRLERREPARPRQKVTVAAVLVKLAQDRDQRVVGRLDGQVVYVAVWKARPATGPLTDPECSFDAQAGMKLGDRVPPGCAARV
jgi:hypothetical protein